MSLNQPYPNILERSSEALLDDRIAIRGERYEDC
jgi:hypothetical protein